jgi:tape measure domain-containing protein
MARRDVELVIRAKNEASKALESIGDAVAVLTKAQDDLVSGASSTDSALSRLGKSITDLEKNFKGLTASAKIGQELDRAAAAMTRLDQETAKAAQEALQYATAAGQAAAATAKLRAESEAQAAAVKSQSAAVEKAKAAQTELNAALSAAVSNRDRLTKADARTEGQIAKQAAAVETASAKYEKLKAEIAAADQPTKTLEASMQRAAEQVDKKSKKLADLNAALEKTRAEHTNTTASVAKLESQLAEATGVYQAQATALEQVQAKHRELQQSVRTAATNQKGLEDSASRTADALDKQKAALERAKTEQGALASSAGTLNSAMASLASGATDALNAAFERQRRTMLETKRAWSDAEASVKEAAAAMRSVEAPTAEMVASFDKARNAARLAKQEYLTQRDGLNAMGAALRTSATDVDGLRARQEQFAAAQSKIAASLAQLRSSTEATSASQRTLGTAAGQARSGLEQTGQGARSAASSMEAGSAGTMSFSEALKSLYGESRTAMSFTQRLRGEVLSLVAAYAGIQAAVSQIGDLVKAYQTLEAVQSRLNVVFGGDQSKTGAELDFLRRTADRLGISFKQLADEYSKFAVASQGTALEGEQTRKIFLAVAEAGRVNKLSAEDMQGTFLALSQMMSKGKIQAEELRGQLGERLPGAFQIMASAIGVTTAELDGMLQAGELTAESALPKFADELNKRFGPALAASLLTTTTQLGALSNNFFQLQIAIGKAGFIEGFTNLLKDMNAALRSPDMATFASKVGAALGGLMNVLAAVARNWQLVVVAMAAFVGVKIAPFIVALGAEIAKMATNLATVPARVAATGTAAVSAASGVGVMTVAMNGLRAAILGLMSSTGIGLIVTAISVGISLWATSADKATEALFAHREIVDKVKNAYEQAEDKANGWQKAVEGVSVTQATERLRVFSAELATLTDKMEKALPVDAFGNDAKNITGQIRSIFDAFKKGEISAEDLKKSLDELAQANPELNRGLALSLQDLSDKLIAAQKNTKDAQAVLVLLSGSSADAKAALDQLGISVKEVGVDFAKAAIEGAAKFKEALEGIKGFIPELRGELKRLKDESKLDEFIAKLPFGPQTKEVMDFIERARNSIASEAVTTGVNGFIGKAMALLKNMEQFRADPYRDSDGRLRIGFGSDTVTLADGTIQKVVAGMHIAVEDANRDLARRVGEFSDRVKGQIGADKFGQFNPDQQAALTSIAYNYGSLPDRLVAAIKGGGIEDIANAIRGLANDKPFRANGEPINKKRRLSEADIFEGGGTTDKAETARIVAAQKLQEEQQKVLDKLNEQVVTTEQQTQLEAMRADGKGKEAAIQEAIWKAQAAATAGQLTLDDAMLAKIRESTGALYDQQHAQDAVTDSKKKAQEAEKEVNNLMAARRGLLEQYNLLQKTGDTGALEGVKTKLGEVNTQLQEAITKAIAMWQAVGGAGADAAITKLNTMSLTLKTQAQSSFLDWSKVGNLFATGLTGAFMDFAQAVAEGQSIGEAARNAFLKFAADFLRKIAEMIIQQAILNALRSIFPGMGFGGGVAGALAGVAHEGGIAGSTNRSRRVDPSIFAGAMRYHTGGIAGLKPGEVPAILQQGEEVLTKADPRHIFNGGGKTGAGGGAAPQVNTKIINAFDSASFLSEALNSRVGEEALINYVRANTGALRSALGV